MRLPKDDPRRRELVVQCVASLVLVGRYTPDEARACNAESGWTDRVPWQDDEGRWHSYGFRGVRLTESELQSAFYQAALDRQRIARVWQSVLR